MREDIEGRVRIVPWGREFPRKVDVEEVLEGPSYIKRVINRERVPTETVERLAVLASLREDMKRPERNRYFRFLLQMGM